MDRLAEMEAFVQVVDHGGFTDAARKMGLSKSAVSKHVSALEARLAVRLLNRTTRRVSPTEVGLAYYDRARSVLAEAAEADSMVTAMQATPKGSLRVSAPVSFGVAQVAPAVARFLCDYPEVDVNMVLDDRFVELVAEGFDLAIRIGTLADSSLKARKLAVARSVIAASPGYLAEAGTPRSIDDLSEHRLLHYSQLSSGNFWRLRGPLGRGAADPRRRPADGQQRRGADAGGRGGARDRADPVLHARRRARGRAAGRGAARPPAGAARDLCGLSRRAASRSRSSGPSSTTWPSISGAWGRTPGRGGSRPVRLRPRRCRARPPPERAMREGPDRSARKKADLRDASRGRSRPAKARRRRPNAAGIFCQVLAALWATSVMQLSREMPRSASSRSLRASSSSRVST